MAEGEEFPSVSCACLWCGRYNHDEIISGLGSFPGGVFLLGRGRIWLRHDSLSSAQYAGNCSHLLESLSPGGLGAFGICNSMNSHNTSKKNLFLFLTSQMGKQRWLPLFLSTRIETRLSQGSLAAISLASGGLVCAPSNTPGLDSNNADTYTHTVTTKNCLQTSNVHWLDKISSTLSYHPLLIASFCLKITASLVLWDGSTEFHSWKCWPHLVMTYCNRP